MLDGLLLWHLEAAAALELPPACDGGNADAALVRPPLHGANEGRWFEVPSLALPLPIVTVAFASPMPAVALVDTMVRAYLCMCRQYFWDLVVCFWDLVVVRSQKFVNHSPHNDVFPLPWVRHLFPTALYDIDMV